MSQRGFFLGWQIVAALVGLAVVAGIVGFSRHQVAKCRAEVAEFRRAYDLLAQSVQRQNEAVQEMEAKAKEAAQRGAQARSQAAGAVDVAKRSAEALSRVMAGARPASECPPGEAVKVVRGDLTSALVDRNAGKFREGEGDARRE